MAQKTGRTTSSGQIGPTDPRLLSSPLDFIAEDNMRERVICALLDRMVASILPDEEDRVQVLAFLKEELPLHLADENIDLFPLMRARCTAEDEIDKVIGRMQSDHGHALTDTPELVDLLQNELMSETGFPDSARARMAYFATHSRRHIIVENAIILPIARVRLTRKDLSIMRLHMLERRGLDRLTEASNAE